MFILPKCHHEKCLYTHFWWSYGHIEMLYRPCGADRRRRAIVKLLRWPVIVTAGAKNFEFWSAISQNSTLQGEKTFYFSLTRRVATHFPPPSYATAGDNGDRQLGKSTTGQPDNWANRLLGKSTTGQISKNQQNRATTGQTSKDQQLKQK